MPLRQIARTPSRPLPPRDGHGIPYAFAVEIRRQSPDVPLNGDTVVVRCPWCGDDERITHPHEAACPRVGRRYTVAIPAGTPVLA